MHREAQPQGLEYGDSERAEGEFTGPKEVIRQAHVGKELLGPYERDLEMIGGLCGCCRVQGFKFDHAGVQCSRRFEWIKAKREALERVGKEWIERYVVCWKCY